MPTGNVKWFDVKKGFGFIVGPEGQDVFVHFSSIVGDGFKTLKDGEPVEYELLEGQKGYHARNVSRVGAKAIDGHGQMPPAEPMPAASAGPSA